MRCPEGDAEILKRSPLSVDAVKKLGFMTWRSWRDWGNLAALADCHYLTPI